MPLAANHVECTTYGNGQVSRREEQCAGGKQSEREIILCLKNKKYAMLLQRGGPKKSTKTSKECIGVTVQKPKTTVKLNLLPQLLHWDATVPSYIPKLFHLSDGFDYSPSIVEGVLASQLLTQGIFHSCQL